jgi:N-acetylmuramoyl-L-alanine amidase
VIVECGFLSNPREERLLQDPDYQEKIAWSIYVGIIKYFDEYNNR